MSGRIPDLAPGDLDAAQRRLYDSLVENEIAWAERAGVRAMAPDGTLLGPFNALFSPVFGTAQVGVFRADKADTSLSRRVHDIVLTVGAAWRSDYELYAHSAMANLAGLPDALIRALASDQPPLLSQTKRLRRTHSHGSSPTIIALTRRHTHGSCGLSAIRALSTS